MEITTLGIDLAKNVFRVHGLMRTGKRSCNRHLSSGSCLRLWRSSSLASPHVAVPVLAGRATLKIAAKSLCMVAMIATLASLPAARSRR